MTRNQRLRRMIGKAQRRFGTTGRPSLGSKHRQKHLESLSSSHGVRNIGGHQQHLARGRAVYFAAYGEFTLTVEDLDQRVKGSGMLAQTLARIESEKRNGPRVVFYQCAADNTAIGIAYHTRSVENFVGGHS